MLVGPQAIESARVHATRRLKRAQVRTRSRFGKTLRRNARRCMTGHMVRITNSIDIDAPAHEVYATLRAVGAYPTWLGHSMVYRGTRTAGPVADASGRYEDSTMLGRMRGELIED